jgi:hypothetical protein
LAVSPPLLTQSLKVICAGEQFAGHSTSGIYRDSFQTKAGCDSFQVTQLVVMDPVKSSINATICKGASIEGYSTAGTYVDTLVGRSGCDSIRTLILSQASAIPFSLNKAICKGDVFAGYSTPGTYLDTLFARGPGCDSVRTLILQVVEISNLQEEVSICAGGNYEGYTQSGIYTKTIKRPGLCDSVFTLKLNVGAVYVPNAFSPDGDKINDTFKVLAGEGSKVEVLRFYIRDRYGNLVFEGKDLDSEWDGTFRGQKANLGLYFYAIELDCGGKRSVLNGGVNLIR